MTKPSSVEPIYKKYQTQIDTIVKIMGNNYTKSAKIIEWLYGNSYEAWRKFLASKKVSKVPDEVKELLKKLK